MSEALREERYERPDAAVPPAVRVRVPAKVNLHLGVGARRPDGYHEVQTVYHAISLYDEVTARPGDPLSLRPSGPSSRTTRMPAQSTSRSDAICVSTPSASRCMD